MLCPFFWRFVEGAIRPAAARTVAPAAPAVVTRPMFAHGQYTASTVLLRIGDKGPDVPQGKSAVRQEPQKQYGDVFRSDSGGLFWSQFETAAAQG